MNRRLLGLIGLVALAGLTGASGDGCEPAPTQGEPCGAGDACASGLTCLHYYGIAGPSGPEFMTCEYPCSGNVDCPTDQVCTLIADGPGNVCQPGQQIGCDPAEEQSCGPELVCVASALGETGTCGDFQHGQSVGAGYGCGGSIGVSCAEGLYCKGLTPGVVGGSGTCTAMTCDDWSEEYQSWVGAINHCTTADDCVSVAGTSCGCTRNVVVNQHEDIDGFKALVDARNDAGCWLVTTCDCPAADGYACTNGVCGWNYQ
jgi:hypothetical protein